MFNRKEYMKKYQQEHKEAFRIATQKYRDKNRKQYNEHSNEYRKRKRKEAKENAELVIKYKTVLDKIKEELTGDFNFEVYICNDNKGSGKTMKLGASIYRNMILEKLNELLEEIE